VLVDYRGYRVVALSLLPISKETLVYGSDDAGVTPRATDPNVVQIMKKVRRVEEQRREEKGGGRKGRREEGREWKRREERRRRSNSEGHGSQCRTDHEEGKMNRGREEGRERRGKEEKKRGGKRMEEEGGATTPE
jgi:hypothetical protein